jgi:hypothetical protein
MDIRKANVALERYYFGECLLPPSAGVVRVALCQLSYFLHGISERKVSPDTSSKYHVEESCQRVGASERLVFTVVN